MSKIKNFLFPSFSLDLNGNKMLSGTMTKLIYFTFSIFFFFLSLKILSQGKVENIYPYPVAQALRGLVQRLQLRDGLLHVDRIEELGQCPWRHVVGLDVELLDDRVWLEGVRKIAGGPVSQARVRDREARQHSVLLQPEAVIICSQY